jgi:hypothetical protein
MVFAGFAVASSYSRWRPLCLTWGALPDEASRDLPGDELLADPDIVSTRAISIDAPPNAIWPWLAQMGPGRGGLYTYDWIENLFGLNMHSADTVIPDLQNITIGDAHKLGTKGPTLRVAICDAGRALVLRSDDGDWVWAFVVEPGADRSRLISRNRIATPGASRLALFVSRYVMEPGSLVMERKMLLTISVNVWTSRSPAIGARVSGRTAKL